MGFSLKRKNSDSFDKKAWTVLGVWSLAYCFGYGLFLVNRGIFSLAQLIVCQSLAPIFSIYISKDHMRSPLSFTNGALSLTPVILLLAIAYFQGLSITGQKSETNLFQILLVVFTTFVISQTTARIISRTKTSEWSQPRLAAFNVCLLLPITWVLGFPGFDTKSLSAFFFFQSLTIGIAFLLVQRFYVFGLSKSEPFMSALFLCTSVPISLLTEAIFNGASIPKLELFLSILYLIFVARKLKKLRVGEC